MFSKPVRFEKLKLCPFAVYTRMFTILIVCTGNTCRSPMAMGILRKMLPKRLKSKIRIMSAGTSTNTGSKASEMAIGVAMKDGIRLQSHRSRQITDELLEEADLILTMSDTHKEHILKMKPECAKKTFLLKEFAFGKEILMYEDRNVEDPFGGDFETYQKCYNEIKDSLKYVVPKIEKIVINNL